MAAGVPPRRRLSLHPTKGDVNALRPLQDDDCPIVCQYGDCDMRPIGRNA